DNPAAARAIVRRKLQSAQTSLDRRAYPQAIAEIDNNRGFFTDTTQQAEALFILAQARFGMAGKDPNALKSAALAFMRVVANFKDAPGHPRVPESLLKTGEVLEALSDSQNARQIYQQLTSQYPDDPAAAQARQNLERLKS
ncbi:MAG: tetratricopeptide repeat protein, partial [Tepidisphaeraceae bacterium]